MKTFFRISLICITFFFCSTNKNGNYKKSNNTELCNLINVFASDEKVQPGDYIIIIIRKIKIQNDSLFLVHISNSTSPINSNKYKYENWFKSCNGRNVKIETNLKEAEYKKLISGFVKSKYINQQELQDESYIEKRESFGEFSTLIWGINFDQNFNLKSINLNSFSSRNLRLKYPNLLLQESLKFAKNKEDTLKSKIAIESILREDSTFVSQNLN